MGAIASMWGVPLALLVGGVLSLAVGVGAWVWLGRIRDAQRAARTVEPLVAVGAAGESPLSVARPKGTS